MYCNVQPVKLLCHHQPSHYRKREYLAEDPGRQWKSLFSFHLKNDFPVEVLRVMTKAGDE